MHRDWWYWLVEVPAFLMDYWSRIYWTLITLMCVGLFSSLALSLVLYSFGIRWGW